jgi:hypothetical protein
MLIVTTVTSHTLPNALGDPHVQGDKETPCAKRT